MGLYPPIAPVADAKVPGHAPVAFNPGDERGQPVQQHLSHCRLTPFKLSGSLAFSAVPSSHQAGVLKHGSVVTA